MGTELMTNGSTALANQNGTAGIVQAEDRTVAASVATAMTEAQGLMMLARQYPRDEDGAFQLLVRSCKRPRFAETALYSFPRGGSNITGPSIKLAREAARIWGNITYGYEIIIDNDEKRRIRAIAIDLQTGTRTTGEDDFKKLVQRKRDGKTTWLTPDERDLRELTNRRASVLIRNCILQLMPADLIDDAIQMIGETLRSGVNKDPEGEKKRILAAFGELGIPAGDLEGWAGKPIKQFHADDIVELRKIFVSIRDGQSTWREHFQPEEKKSTPPKKSLNDLKGKPKEEKPPVEEEPDMTDDGEIIPPRREKFGLAE